jgi:ribosome biogenesis protein MAK21
MQVASTAGYVLSQLVEAHKDLSVLVAGTVQQMVLRPKTTPRGKYYAVVFLNQLVLTKGSSELPNTLMRIYFALFEACLEGTGAKSKLLAALLTGVNRAFPYSALDADFMAARVNALFRIVHTTTFNTSVQALRLLSQVGLPPVPVTHTTTLPPTPHVCVPPAACTTMSAPFS